MSEILTARNMSAGYDKHPVVHDLDLSVSSGEIVVLLGSNGAGKTTTLLALAGEAAVLSGEVTLDNRSGRIPLHRRARSGLGFVTEERSVFMRMSVADNLRIGGCDVDRAYELFPELRPLKKRTTGLLSGGEQQILTLARALARRPKVLLADELSLGLAPLVIRRLLLALRQAVDEEGLGVVLVEQHVQKALSIADRAYVMSQGRIAVEGSAEDVRARFHEVEEAYLSQTARNPTVGSTS